MTGRSPLFRRLLQTIRSTRSGDRPSVESSSVGRRQMLRMGAAAAGAVAGASFLGGCSDGVFGAPTESVGQVGAGLRNVGADIGIVGAGLAGLSCAYELKKAGANATLHEANTRHGGRVWSMGGAFAGPVMFPGQVIERGGELIDTPHKTMIGYANEFGLTLEDVAKPVRDTFYYFGGQRYSEAQVVAEYRILVDAMRDDLRAIGAPTASNFTPAERALDIMSLRQWLEARNAPPLIKKLLNVAYAIEYGLETDKISCLSFLLFAKASRQSKLRLWGNFSDERYHVVGGNQQIPDAIAARLPNQINYGRKLVAARKTAAGRVELTFKEGSRTVTATHDAVVVTLPFTVLRDVELDPSLGLPDWKKYAINNVKLGTNSKLMVGFQGRPWVDQGSSGAAYSDMFNLQTTWETSPGAATSSRGVITSFTGGNLGMALTSGGVQGHADAFHTSFNTVYPGAKALARRDSQGNYVAHIEPWPVSPFTKGSYSTNQPGYFTSICDNEGKAVGNVYFAGETTSSFYEWQGFMEGAALSGLRVAGEIVRDFG